MSRNADKRRARLQRLRQATRHLKRMEELRMRQLHDRLQALQRQRRNLLGALGRGALPGIGGDLALLLRRNLDAAAREEARLRALMEKHEEALRHRRAQERQLRQMQERADRALRRARQDASLQEIVDGILRRDGG